MKSDVPIDGTEPASDSSSSGSISDVSVDVEKITEVIAMSRTGFNYYSSDTSTDVQPSQSQKQINVCNAI